MTELTTERRKHLVVINDRPNKQLAATLENFVDSRSVFFYFGGFSQDLSFGVPCIYLILYNMKKP